MTATWQVSVECPKCHRALSISHQEGDTKPQMEDRLVCPVHGDVGSYRELQPLIKNAVRDEVKRRIKEALKGK